MACFDLAALLPLLPRERALRQAFFTDPSHFYREFRAQFGVSPRSFRQSAVNMKGEQP